MNSTPSDINDKIIAEFRANGGKVGGYFDGTTLLLLHHVGRRSGTKRVTPLVYLDGDEMYYVFASNAGAPKHPIWYHNLLNSPSTYAEIGDDTVEVRAVEVTGVERDKIFNRMVDRLPGFADYQKKTERVIPVLALVRQDI